MQLAKALCFWTNRLVREEHIFGALQSEHLCFGNSCAFETRDSRPEHEAYYMRAFARLYVRAHKLAIGKKFSNQRQVALNPFRIEDERRRIQFVRVLDGVPFHSFQD